MIRRLTLVVLCLSTTFLFAAATGAWLRSVPQQERARINPYAEDANAVAAGAILYKRSCSSCHGGDAQGIGRRPSLRTARVHEATDGELHWLLTNGNLARGMPSWSRLPDDQRWQLTRYLHTLPVDESKRVD
jgi:mono/diheme cytochrome c family protein